MPFPRKSLAGLTADTEENLAIETGEDDRFPASDRLALARSVGGGLHGLYGYIDWVSRQIVPMTADEDKLIEHADWWGVRRKAATAAEGRILFKGTAGAVVPVGTVLQRKDGWEYVVTLPAEITIEGVAETSSVAVKAGANGNCEEGTPLSLAATVSRVQGTATAMTFSLGADEETVEDLRARLADRVQEPPMGGAVHDYRRWALEVPGVTRAWAWANWVGRGTVGVAIVADRQAGSIIPDQALVAKVQAYIEDPERLAPGCEPRVFAPTPKWIKPVIGSLDPATPSVKQAVIKSLGALFTAESEPGGVLLVSHLRNAISEAVGENDHVLVWPTENIVAGRGEMALFEGVEWRS